MASSESQGKTIALVVFVFLWFGSSVAAYVFWQKWDAAAAAGKNGDAAAKKAEGEANTAKANFRSLRSKIFFSNEELAPDVVLAKVDAEILKPDLPKNAPANIAKAIDDVKPYQTCQDGLKQAHNLLQIFADQIGKLDKDKKELEEQLKSARAQYSAENKKFQDAAVAADKDKKSEVANLEATIQQKSIEIEGVQRRNNAMITEREQTQRDYDRTMSKLKQENQSLTDNLANVKQREEKLKEIKFIRSSGKVVELTDGGRSAVIDKGHADGVQTGLTFGIYGRDRGGNPYELPKAACEVVRVIDDHRSVARLSLEQLRNPVLPEDLLFNPVWTPGEKEGIAFVGLIRMGRGADDDSAAFKKLIEDNGGKIDSYMDLATGQVKGAIDVKTQWLVIGDFPEPDPKVSDKFDKKPTELYDRLITANNLMREQARRNGVRVVNLRNFLAYWGYDNPERTVPAGKEYDLIYKKAPRGRDLPNDDRQLPRRSESAAPKSNAGASNN